MAEVPKPWPPRCPQPLEADAVGVQQRYDDLREFKENRKILEHCMKIMEHPVRPLGLEDSCRGKAVQELLIDYLSSGQGEGWRRRMISIGPKKGKWRDQIGITFWDQFLSVWEHFS